MAPGEEADQLVEQRPYRVGDLATAPRMAYPDGRLLVCRVVSIFIPKALLAPIERGVELPRSVPLDQLALIEAWTGPEMLSCKEDGSVEHWPGDFDFPAGT